MQTLPSFPRRRESRSPLARHSREARHSCEGGNPGAPRRGLSNRLLVPVLLLTLALLAAPTPAHTDPPLAALLPETGALPGWNQAESPLFYGPENLWDCINGAAALYLDYGFKSLATAYYKTTDEESTAALEIYQMETPLHAFAIYAAERTPEEEFIKIGTEGYLGENTLNFWKGPYYTKVSSYRANKGTKSILTNLASIVADRIPGQYTEPEAFTYFPAENRVAKSERYIPKNFLGHPFLKAGYRVDYQSEQGSYQLFLVPNNSPAEAETAFTKYLQHLASQYPGLTAATKSKYQTISTTDGRTAFLYKTYVGGILNVPDPAAARKLTEEMITRLNVP